MKKSIAKILQDAPKTAAPTKVAPMALTLIQQPFNHRDWQFEIKWDGFRLLSYLHGSDIEIKSRNNNSFNGRFAAIKNELQKLNLFAVLDGEAVVLNSDGLPDFNQIISGDSSAFPVYYVFDLLWFNGYDLMNLPLWKRRKVLKSILPKSDIVRFSDHVNINGKELFNLVKQKQIEGIVAKHKDSLYVPGSRTDQWLKIKTGQRIRGVIAGYLIDKDKKGAGLCSLIIGAREKQGYKYLGLVGFGVSPAAKEKIFALKPTKKCVFPNVPKVNARTPFRTPIKNAEIIWIKPELQCEIKFLEFDQFGLMRHASFKGIVR